VNDGEVTAAPMAGSGADTPPWLAGLVVALLEVSLANPHELINQENMAEECRVERELASQETKRKKENYAV